MQTFLDACGGLYTCGLEVQLLDYQPGLNVLTLTSDDGTTTGCNVGSDVPSLPIGVDFNNDGTLTNLEQEIGTWTTSDGAVKVCIGLACTTCTGGGNVTQPAPDCDATLGCDKELPLTVPLGPTDLTFLVQKGDDGACSFTAGGGGEFAVESDGTLSAQGFPVGTWTGTEDQVQLCILGECTQCSAQ